MKARNFLTVLMLALASFSFAQEAKFQLSSHILDITKGEPAPGVKISLSKQDKAGKWTAVDEKITDQNGRITDFLKVTKGVDNEGIYKLTYFVAPYFKKMKQDSFYPFIEVVFEIKGESHFHVPITLSAYGYSTYRGN
ncbi:hydroxyisourate hydrolase [Chryseobacterium gotjawalense]|uniref:5-hydroxyisourate hydrolase n=2 Tax=Chryseobacterium TaxID=59732 RepID=A0A4P6ZI78_9FLAO|nr:MULTISPECIES: hydroxyisourate hydrolase [Chryseobacterium]MDQ0477251.1 5-hydroxyisourate hydrolase [Chryseobacterium sp. MDT2-18]QBO59322.1 5-hydroxyisourate hydrolase [Chryseobacterium salivictor]WHF52484.1 hydroxyisourate hydrolase [Chryseobacterium sp. wdc7]